MKKCFAVQGHSKQTDLALLALRLITGLAFILHGWGKIQNPMGWMGPDSFMPGIVQALVAIAEFGGGIAFILGLVTRLAALGLALTMLGAAGVHAFLLGDPFVSKGGGSYELASIYFFISCLYMATGPGKFSLDCKVFGTK
jgi:putative oxidoreductase